MKMHVEVTDLFGGEANYGWVRRYSEELSDPHPSDIQPSDLAVVRRAKALAGWSGMRCRTTNYYDSIELRPYGVLQVMFITFNEDF